jgi:hypothetical protein
VNLKDDLKETLMKSNSERREHSKHSWHEWATSDGAATNIGLSLANPSLEEERQEFFSEWH